MKHPPIAQVRILEQPHLHPEAVRVEVECSGSTTGITHVPGGALEFDTPTLTTMAVYEHQARCGDCDTSEAHQRGSQPIREHVEQVAARLRGIRARRYVEGVRN
jgi:hypothetical protein